MNGEREWHRGARGPEQTARDIYAMSNFDPVPHAKTLLNLRTKEDLFLCSLFAHSLDSGFRYPLPSIPTDYSDSKLSVPGLGLAFSGVASLTANSFMTGSYTTHFHGAGGVGLTTSEQYPWNGSLPQMPQRRTQPLRYDIHEGRIVHTISVPVAANVNAEYWLWYDALDPVNPIQVMNMTVPATPSLTAVLPWTTTPFRNPISLSRPDDAGQPYVAQLSDCNGWERVVGKMVSNSPSCPPPPHTGEPEAPLAPACTVRNPNAKAPIVPNLLGSAAGWPSLVASPTNYKQDVLNATYLGGCSLDVEVTNETAFTCVAMRVRKNDNYTRRFVDFPADILTVSDSLPFYESYTQTTTAAASFSGDRWLAAHTFAEGSVYTAALMQSFLLAWQTGSPFIQIQLTNVNAVTTAMTMNVQAHAWLGLSSHSVTIADSANLTTVPFYIPLWFDHLQVRGHTGKGRHLAMASATPVTVHAALTSSAPAISSIANSPSSLAVKHALAAANTPAVREQNGSIWDSIAGAMTDVAAEALPILGRAAIGLLTSLV